MGSGNSLQFIENPLPKDYRNTIDNPNIFISIVDQTQLEKHTITISTRAQLLEEQQMFIFRKCNSDHIVSARHFESISVNELCANSYSVTYYTQHPEKRFFDLREITYQQGYSYLIDALKGFSILTQKVGFFNVTSKMIVFDQDRRVKVWISQNFSQTRVKKQRKVKSEAEFLNKIVKIIEGKLNNKGENRCQYWTLLSRHLNPESKKLTLKQALNILISQSPHYLTNTKNFLNSCRDSQNRKSNQVCQNAPVIDAKDCNGSFNLVSSSFQKQKSLKRTKKGTSEESERSQNWKGTVKGMSKGVSAKHSKMVETTPFGLQTASIPNRNTIAHNSNWHHKEQRRTIYERPFIIQTSQCQNAFTNMPKDELIRERIKSKRYPSQQTVQCSGRVTLHNGASRKSMDEIDFIKKREHERVVHVEHYRTLAQHKLEDLNHNTVTIPEINSNGSNPPRFNYQYPKGNFYSRNTHRVTKTAVIPNSKENYQIKANENDKVRTQIHSKTNSTLKVSKLNHESEKSFALSTSKSTMANKNVQYHAIHNNDTMKCPKRSTHHVQAQVQHSSASTEKLSPNHISTFDSGATEKASEKKIRNEERKVPIDQLNTIKSIVYSDPDANVSETVSLELFDSMNKQFF